MLNKILPSTALAAIALVASAGANALVITEYTSYSAWSTALSGQTVTTETFSDPFLVSGVSYSLGGSGHGFAGVYGGQFIDRLTDTNSTTWHFTPGVYAFGGNWDLSINGPGLGIDVYAGSSGISTGPTIANTFTGGFWGFIADTSISNVVLRGGNTNCDCVETYALDNMRFARGPVTAVPEPATLTLFGFALGALGLATRRRRSA